MKTICCVFGTRPEAVKMAPVVLALRARPQEFRCLVVVTAQHRSMLDEVLAQFGIVPDHDLGIMTPSQSLTAITVKVLERLEPVFKAERPDLILVHGDTTTTLAASLAAFYQRVPVGHVEAGLRSFDKDNPFPEELNRIVADGVAKLHFAPTAKARQNLRREGIANSGIFITGNTGIDALRIMTRRMHREGTMPRPEWQALARNPFLLITAHRRENFGAPLVSICHALADVASAKPRLNLIYPVHPNPNVQGPATEILGKLPNVHLLPPLEYRDLLYFLERSEFVITDSGGLQEESPSLGKPVLVLRDVTERPEAVRAGTARIVGTDRANVRRWVLKLLDDRKVFTRMANAVNPYGDGRAADRTVQAIRYFFGQRRARMKDFAPAIGKQRTRRGKKH